MSRDEFTKGKFFVNNKYKLAYLKLPKCACTSIASAIAELKTPDVKRPLWHHEEHNFDTVTTDYTSLSNYLTFTFVRNPFDRFTSFYKNWITDPPHDRVLRKFSKFGVYENMPFDECVKKITKIKDVRKLESHTIPIYYYLFHNGCLKVKYIGRMESINEDFEIISAACGIPGMLGEFNQSKRKDDFYTPSLKKKIREFYSIDFNLLGYDRNEYISSPSNSRTTPIAKIKSRFGI